ncbi:MAG: bifunctional nicotinamidase/pyrazinamidase [Granulosicoccus sp.]
MNINDDDCLLIIDVQNDFCSGGSLAVPDAEAILPVVNSLSGKFSHVVLTQDWHPAKHSSFASRHAGKQAFDTVTLSYGEQTLWPDHCVQGTSGAGFHPELLTDNSQMIIRKGFRAGIDSYSAFFENDHSTTLGLTGYLRERGVRRVVCVGLALDYCVRFSAIDARREGFEATVIQSGCRGIDVDGSNAAACQAMHEAGVVLET